jgi:hypothetical protein
VSIGSRWIPRTILVLAAGVWAWVMIVLGLLILTDWRTRFVALLHAPYPALCVGAALVASGVFVFAMAAVRLFPLANPRITAMFEVFPWLALALVLIGGLV